MESAPCKKPVNRGLRPLQALMAAVAWLLGAPWPAYANEDRAAGGAPDAAGELAELSLEQLLSREVVTATRTARKLQDAPAAITVLTRRELVDWGYTSVHEVLRHLVGFYVVDDHITPDAAVRGVPGGLRGESGLIKVMIDGRSVAFRSTASNWLGPELVPMTAVERIEILRGPASALYGADAFLGVVNVITAAGGDFDGAELRVHGGLVGSRPGGGQDLVIGSARDRASGLLAARFAYEDRSGLVLPASAPAPRIPAYNEDDLRADGLAHVSWSAFAKGSYALAPGALLAVSGHVSGLERGAEFAESRQLTHGLDTEGRQSGSRVALAQGRLGAQLSLSLSPALRVSADASVFAGGPSARDRVEVGSDIYYVERDFGFRGVELQLNGDWSSGDWSVLVGGGLIADDEQLPSTLHIAKSSVGGLAPGDIRESTSTRQGRRGLYNLGAHLQGIWSPLPARLSVTGGLRYDYDSTYQSQLSGRAGVVYHMAPGLNLKLLYGSAFKAPSPLLLYGIPLAPGGIQGNEELRPQFIHTFEGQLVYVPRSFLSLTSGLSYSLLRNTAEFQQQGLNQVARNVAEVGALSWENQLEFRLLPVVAGYANLGLQRTVRDRGGHGYVAQLLGSGNVVYPVVLAKAGVRSTWVPRVQLTVEAIFAGSRRSTDPNSLERGAPYRLPSYVSCDASASTVLRGLLTGRTTRLSLLGRNLFDAAGPDPGFAGVDYPLTPRTLTLLLTQEL